MPQGELGASSFEFYEGIRIFIPGAVAVGLYAAIAATFGLEVPSPAQSLIGAAFASLVVGLLLYYLDLPARSTTYRTEQPDELIAEWPLPKEMNRANFYFVLLDVDVPSGIRNRALYMGSMYRIGLELVYLLFLTATAVVSVAILVPSAGPERAAQDVPFVFWCAVATFVLLWVGCAVFDLRRPPQEAGLTIGQRRRKRAAELVGQIGIAGGASLVIAVAAAVFYRCSNAPVAGAVAIALPAIWWVVANFKGYRRDKRWHRVSLPIAVFWSSWTGSTVFALAALETTRQSTLGLNEAVGWALAALTAAVILQSRGPERKLRGSYWTQRTWLRVNELKLRKKYGLDSPR